MDFEPVDTRIKSYINENKVFTLATSKNNIPYSALCFYAYNEVENYFVFSSDNTTKHVRDFIQQPLVSGSIYKKTPHVNLIKGLQFTGKIIETINKEKKEIIKNIYIKTFPFTRLMKLNLWLLQPTFFKLTDNSLGFGKKICWNSLYISENNF